MKKIITLAAIVVLATGDFALAGQDGKKGCCGTCKKDAAEKAACSGGACSKSK